MEHATTAINDSILIFGNKYFNDFHWLTDTKLVQGFV